MFIILFIYSSHIVFPQTFDAENREHAELMVKYQKTALELVETKQQVQVGNYMIENFDKIKSYALYLHSKMRALRSEIVFYYHCAFASLYS